MRKLAVIVAVLSVLGVAETGGAQLIVNGDWSTGDETGWTRWREEPGGGENWALTSTGPAPPEGELSFSGFLVAYFGWYQVVDVSPGIYTLDCLWSGYIFSISGRSEILFFTVPEGTSSADIELRIRLGVDEDIFSRYDTYDGPVDMWDWSTPIPFPDGNDGTCVVSGSEDIVVALKIESSGTSPIWVRFDNITLTGETPTPTNTPTNAPTNTPTETVTTGTPTLAPTPTLSTGIGSEEWRVYR